MFSYKNLVNRVLLPLLAVQTAFMFAGSLLKILHAPGAWPLLVAALAIFAVCWSLALAELATQKVYNKQFWLVGLAVMPALGLWAYAIRRKDFLQP